MVGLKRAWMLLFAGGSVELAGRLVSGHQSLIARGRKRQLGLPLPNYLPIWQTLRRMWRCNLVWLLFNIVWLRNGVKKLLVARRPPFLLVGIPAGALAHLGPRFRSGGAVVADGAGFCACLDCGVFEAAHDPPPSLGTAAVASPWTRPWRRPPPPAARPPLLVLRAKAPQGGASCGALGGGVLAKAYSSDSGSSVATP